MSEQITYEEQGEYVSERVQGKKKSRKRTTLKNVQKDSNEQKT